MAVLEREAFFERLESMVTGTDESSIAFIEDMTDTYNDLETRAEGDGTDWKQRYEELDAQWKEKYRHRFFSGGTPPNPNLNTRRIQEDEADPPTPPITIDDLFR